MLEPGGAGGTIPPFFAPVRTTGKTAGRPARAGRRLCRAHAPAAHLAPHRAARPAVADADAARTLAGPRGPRPVRPDLLETIRRVGAARSEEHTSELQSLMRISYAVF